MRQMIVQDYNGNRVVPDLLPTDAPPQFFQKDDTPFLRCLSIQVEDWFRQYPQDPAIERDIFRSSDKVTNCYGSAGFHPAFQRSRINVKLRFVSIYDAHICLLKNPC